MADTIVYFTGSGAMASSLTLAKAFQLKEVRLHIDASVAATENFTINLNANKAAAHDVNLITKAMNGVADYVYQPDNPQSFEANDVIDFAFTNTDVNTWGLAVVYN